MKKLVQRALIYAIGVHEGQIYNGGMFVQHPIQVYELIKQVAPEDENLQAAALLHDTVEDTYVEYDDLEEIFNEDVANLVREVTKDENKDFPNLSTPRGLMLKAADRLANCANLIGTDREAKLFKKYSFCFRDEGTHRRKLMK